MMTMMTKKTNERKRLPFCSFLKEIDEMRAKTTLFWTFLGVLSSRFLSEWENRGWEGQQNRRSVGEAGERAVDPIGKSQTRRPKEMGN